MITLHLEFKKGNSFADITIPQAYNVTPFDKFTIPSEQKWTVKLVLSKQPFRILINGISYLIGDEMELLPATTIYFERDNISTSFEADVVFDVHPYF